MVSIRHIISYATVVVTGSKKSINTCFISSFDNGDGTYTYNVNIEETGECGGRTSYFHINEIYIDRPYNDVSVRFTYPISTRINFN